MNELPTVDVADTYLSRFLGLDGRLSRTAPGGATMTRKTNDTDGEQPPTEGTTLEGTEWEARPTDPDLHTDLDYDLVNWEVVQAACDDKQVFLPIEESMLKDEAFIVAEPDACCDLGTKL